MSPSLLHFDSTLQPQPTTMSGASSSGELWTTTIFSISSQEIGNHNHNTTNHNHNTKDNLIQVPRNGKRGGKKLMLDRRTLLWMAIEDMDLLPFEPIASDFDAMKLYQAIEDELWLINPEVYMLWEDKSLLMLTIAAIIQEMTWRQQR